MPVPTATKHFTLAFFVQALVRCKWSVVLCNVIVSCMQRTTDNEPWTIACDSHGAMFFKNAVFSRLVFQTSPPRFLFFVTERRHLQVVS